MKPKKKKAKSSLLARLFGAKAKAKAAAKKPAKAEEAKPAAAKSAAPKKDGPPKRPPPTPLDRSIAEIKTMVRIGQNNPARLANILGNIIKAEQAKKAEADEKYQQLIQDILDREQQKEQDPPPPT